MLSVPPEPPFRTLLTSRICSALAGPAVPVLLVMTVLSNSPGPHTLSAVLAAEAAPAVVFLFVGGVVSDRFSRRRLVVTADVISAATCALLAALLWSHAASTTALCALAAVNGANQALLFPAYRALFPRTVAPTNLQAANSIRSLIGSLSGIVGPALAGALTPVVGLAGAWSACAAGYAASAVLMLRVAVDAQGSTDDSVLAQMRSSWRYFRSQRWLVAVDAYAAVWHLMVWAPFLVAGALVVDQRYGGAHSWGYLQASIGAGTLLGAVLANRMRLQRVLVVAVAGVGIFGAVDLGLGAGLPLSALLAAAAVGGVGLSVGDICWSATLQARVPDSVLGQIFSYDYLVSVALLPFGLMLVPSLSAAFGNTALLTAGGVVSFAGMVALWVLPSVRSVLDETPTATTPTPTEALA